MLNLNPEDINSVGKTIGSIIFLIIIFIGIIIIFDEIFQISKFCFKYTYLYNYGKLNENICKKDANNLIEFETSRFRIYNEINKYKLQKDIFNKNWINYAVFISISIITILACFAFGYLFYHFFIANNDTCEFNIDENIKPDDPRISFINRLLDCMGIKQKLPNCTYNYFIFYIIILFYPLIYILKFFFKIDWTFNNNKLVVKIFHYFVLLNLLYYLFILFKIEDKEDTWNITKLTVFISFMIVFYLADYIYNKSYDEYYNINKGTNIYSGNKTLVNILNKYFNFAKDDGEFNKDDNRDVNFFEIYKQQEPEKPIVPEKPTYTPIGSSNISNLDLLTNFKTCRNEDFNDPKNSYCYQFHINENRSEYNKQKNLIDKYYKDKEEYDKNLNTYNFKLNIYKNNKIEFPEFVSLLYNMIPVLLGFNKTSHQYLFILLIIIAVIYHLLKVNKKTQFSQYIYNTILIYVIAVLSILILSNAILNYNTYANKYLIYEPTSFYKEDITNLDSLFNVLLNKDNNKVLSDNYIDLYNGLNGDKLIKFNQNFDPSKQTSGEKIKTLLDNNIDFSNFRTSNSNDIVEQNNDNFNNLRKQILRVIFTDFFNINGNINSSNLSSNMISNINNDYLINEPSFYTYNSNDIGDMKPDLRTFFINIKNIFIEDPNDIDKHIQNIKMNLIYLVFNNKNDNPMNDNFYTNFVKYPSKDDLDKIDKTKTNTTIAFYLNNINNINKIFDYYKQFLLKFRSIIIKLFNSTEIYCENDDTIININTKLNIYLNKLFKQKQNYNIDFNINNYFTTFSYKTEEKLIDLYKKILSFYMSEIALEFKRYLNIIKVIYRNDLVDVSDKPNKLEYNIINNYNFFNKDTRKHTLENLIRNQEFIIKIKKNLNKYSNYDSNQILKLNLSINNISWSFVILMIIFAVFLIEPIIIQS